MLRAVGLTKRFGSFTALDRFDLAVRPGAIHALIGPNGAGKTTAFNLLTKFHEPTEGRIVFSGEDVTALRPAAVSRKGLVRSFQISATFLHLTVLENVRIALQRRAGLADQFWRSDRVLTTLNERARALLADVNLDGFADRLAVDLSYGRRRALELATTIALDPKMLLLDEPMAGLGHEDIQAIVALVRKVAVGRTVLMVEHNLSVVSDLCDIITVLQHGKVIAEGGYAAIAADARVREAYLGTEAA